nr:MAG TPA: hypothetical protein [Caudoviricetes sp.]
MINKFRIYINFTVFNEINKFTTNLYFNLSSSFYKKI